LTARRHKPDVTPGAGSSRDVAAAPATAPVAAVARSRWPFSFRETVRFGLFATLLVAFVQYVRFWSYVQTGTGAPTGRPNVADAFLPLGGLAALKAWLRTGYFDQMHPAAIIVVLAIIVTAWLFRRAPCSWLCPIGAASEYLGKLGRRLFGKNVHVPKWLDRSLIGLKYVGTFAFLFWLLSAPMGSVRDFMATPFYAVADMKLFDVYAKVGVGMMAAVGAVFAVSIPVKSAWCRYLCPYGALQGIFGVLSPVVLAKNDETCTGCARCNRACPNGVDVAHSQGAVVSAECMGCTSCVEACPQADTLQMKLGGRRTLDSLSFGLLFAVAFLAIITLAVVTGHFGNGLSPQDYRAMLQMSSDVHLPM
jgi:polyferredoxin